MAKVSRYATARIATTVNARYKSESPESGYYLDGRRVGDRERRGVDVTVDREDRGFFYAVYRTNEDMRDMNSPVVRSLNELTEAAKFGNQNIDNEINDLADAAVQVTGRATLGRGDDHYPYFAGILVKEAEIAAVTTGAGCAYLYRDDILYPLTESDFPLEAIDYNGEPVQRMNDYSAGVAGTIRYSNIAQIQQNDCIILTSADVMEAIGQREMLRLLFEAQDQADAAQSIMAIASAKLDRSVQVMIGFVEYVSPAGKTGKLNLGLFQGGTSHDMDGATTRFEPIRDERMAQPQQPAHTNYKPAEPQYVPQPEQPPVQKEAPKPAPAEPVEEDLEAGKAVDLNQQVKADEAMAPADDEYNLPGEKYHGQEEDNTDRREKDTEPVKADDGEKKTSLLWGADEDTNFDAYNAGREYARKLNADKDGGYSYGDDRDFDLTYSETHDADDPYAPLPTEHGFRRNRDGNYDPDYQEDYDRDYPDEYDRDYPQEYHRDDYDYDDHYAAGDYRDDRYGDDSAHGRDGHYDHYDDNHYDKRQDDHYGKYGADYGDNRHGRYEDDYDNYEVYDGYQDQSTKTKRTILYVILVLICIACIVVLVKMLKGGDDKKPDSSLASTTTAQNNIVVPPAGDNSKPDTPSEPGNGTTTTTQSSSSASSTTTTTTTTVAPPQGGQTYTVVEGDTMWGIAAKFYPEDKITQGMELIRQANGRTEEQDGELRIGEELTIPELP